MRAAVASTLGTLEPEQAVPLLLPLLKDQDQRAVPAVLAALAAVKAPEVERILLEHLKADDPVVRAAAAPALGELRPAGTADALATALSRPAERDPTYAARGAILGALAKYGRAAAEPTLIAALKDKDWAVRVRAASLLKTLDPARDTAAAIRPAPTTVDAATIASSPVVSPPYSTHVYVDTDKGTFQIELAVLDAPLTVYSFITLARKGFFDGLSIHRVVPGFVLQDGDPRGDGEGGPGYTLRDEINERPYLRGTVGMALDWQETGGSQVLHHLRPAAAPRRALHRLRTGDQRDGGRRAAAAVGRGAARARVGRRAVAAYKKRGRKPSRPTENGSRVLPLLRGRLLLPALGCFLCHANPPFHPCGCASGSSAPAPVSCRLARVRLLPDALASYAAFRASGTSGDSCTKRGGCSLNTPCGLPLLRGLLLAASGLLRSFLRHFSSWSGGCSACPPLLGCNNGWSERSTLIQDVDYG